MRRFLSAFLWLQHIRVSTVSNILAFIAGLLSIPCFKTAEFFFKLVYLLNRRRIALLGGDDLFPEIRNGSVPFDGIVKLSKRLRSIEHGIEGAYARKYFTDHDVSSSA